MKAKVVFVVILLAAGLGFARHQRAASDDSVLQLSGTIESREVQVGSLLGGRVAAVHLEEGATVAAGDRVVTFETDMLDAQVEEQEARVSAARAGREKAHRGPRIEEVARARAEHQNAEADRQRMDALRQEGIVARQQYDATATRAATTRETLLQLERGNRREDVAAAEATLAAEEQRLALLQTQRAESVVHAPAAGVVQSLDLRPGDMVAAGRPVASLLEPSQLWVRVYVPEPSLGLVNLGDAVRVTVDSFPDRAFPGKVVEVASRAEYMPRNVQTLEQRTDQVFGVKVALQPTPSLKPGMAALVRLDVTAGAR